MRYCYRGIWTCLLISRACLLTRISGNLDQNTRTLLYLSSRTDNAACCLFQASCWDSAWESVFAGSARLLTIRKSDLSDKIKREFFQAVSVVVYSCTPRTLTKRLEKNLNDNYTRMLPTVLNKSWKQHSTKRQLHGHLPPILRGRRTRHARHWYENKTKYISDVPLWTHLTPKPTVIGSVQTLSVV